ncbi:hypothetical protein EVAR_42438_1 [Eumeta japonica]|uniref:Nucleic-acid-binding protein from transposon X-element n=1 Tax=Eumeta variegata TaxID=151549 RepID=A0A4C1X9G5_EUMVA|nr:hypothetical protein EVAR_42438_1 [Eumeta japonica]
MDQDSSCSSGAGGSGPKTPITFEFIQQVLTKALSEIGYEASQDVASSSSEEGATCSDSTVVDSDTKVARDQPEMDIDPSSAPASRANDAQPSPVAVQQTQTTSTAPVESTRNPVSASTQVVTAKTAPRKGAKPTALPRPKLPPPIFLRKGANFLQISADCIRLRINYSKAVRTADDGIKIHCPDVDTFRSLNKYLVNFKVQFHTYALEEERKLKAVIRGIPTDFPVDEIQADLCGQASLCTRTEEAKNIFNNLNRVCGLSGIRVEAPHKKGGPGQCHRCQLYGHAAANSCGPTLHEMFGPTLDQRVPAYSPNPNRPKSRPVAPPRDLNNFPDLAGNKPTPPAAASRPASNPWGKPNGDVHPSRR